MLDHRGDARIVPQRRPRIPSPKRPSLGLDEIMRWPNAAAAPSPPGEPEREPEPTLRAFGQQVEQRSWTQASSTWE